MQLGGGGEVHRSSGAKNAPQDDKDIFSRKQLWR